MRRRDYGITVGGLRVMNVLEDEPGEFALQVDEDLLFKPEELRQIANDIWTVAEELRRNPRPRCILARYQV